MAIFSLSLIFIRYELFAKIKNLFHGILDRSPSVARYFYLPYREISHLSVNSDEISFV